MVLESFEYTSEFDKTSRMNWMLIIVIFASFADAFRRSGFFKFHGHKTSGSAEITNDQSIKNIRRVMIKRNEKLMRLIASIESLEKRDALMSAMTETTEKNKQKIRLVSIIGFFGQF